MTHRTRAVLSLACGVVCIPAIALYGVTHEGTTLDKLVAWGFVLLAFVFVCAFGYHLARWDD